MLSLGFGPPTIPPPKTAKATTPALNTRQLFSTKADEDKAVIDASIENAQKEFTKPIVTVVRKAEKFYEAPDEHQDYYFQNKSQGYCQYVHQAQAREAEVKEIIPAATNPCHNRVDASTASKP